MNDASTSAIPEISAVTVRTCGPDSLPIPSKMYAVEHEGTRATSKEPKSSPRRVRVVTGDAEAEADDDVESTESESESEFESESAASSEMCVSVSLFSQTFSQEKSCLQ